MTINTLSNFALLKTFTDTKKDLLDSLLPFVEFGISYLNKEYLNAQDVKECIEQNCSISIPSETLKSLLKRMKRANKITDMQNWEIIHCVDDYSKNSTQYTQELNKTNRHVNQLINEFKKYSHKELSDDELIQNFYNFIDEYQKYMDLSAPYIEMENVEFYEINLVISSFLMEISRNNDDLYNVFKSVFYGFILSRFIAKGTKDKDNKIEDLTVYVDTNYVLRILDFQSEYFTTSSSELLSLMQREGLKVVVMPEIVEEVQGVLTKSLETYSKNKENLLKMYGDRIKSLDGIFGAFVKKRFEFK